MNMVYIFGGVGLALFIIGIIMTKFGSNRGKAALQILGFVFAFMGIVSCYFGYDEYQNQPNTYTIKDYSEEEHGYKITLNSNIKGVTGGNIFITLKDAEDMELAEYNIETGEWIWKGGTIEKSRKWVNDHLKS